METKQLLRASDGRVCDDDPKPNGWHMDCDTHGGRFEPRAGASHEIIVALAGMPGQEVAVSLWRSTMFTEDDAPTVVALEEALVAKYGPQHIRQTEEGYYSLGHRKDATVLSWIYRPDGQRITSPDSLKQRCVNGPRPFFTTRHSWNGACGLTVRAEILPMRGKSLLAAQLNVTAVDQKALIDALTRFDTELAAALSGKARQPDL